MGKPTGFLEAGRQGAPQRDVDERLRDYRELYHERASDVVRQQGGRCMDCGVPFCQQGCPLGNLIPDWNDLVYRDRWHEAWLALRSTNNFPEFTGRLCPAPCEAACVLAINDSAVTIEQIEKEIVERAFSEGWVKAPIARSRTGMSVAIVGSGPAGLAAAEQLAAAGHDVTVFEQADRIGGLLRYGIPDFKMEKWVIDRRLDLMREAGVVFRTGVEVGRDVAWATLADEHDALLVAVGATRARDLAVPGRELGGVHFAMDYLEQQNRVVAGDDVPADGPAGARIDAAGRHVIILGGGDTGSDCLGTALRQGAASVTQIELMPEPPQERAPGNPWPRWPHVFRVSSSQAEGGEREFAVMTTALEGTDGRVTGLRAVEVNVSHNDGRTNIELIEGTERVIPCDLLLLAMGFTGPVADGLHDELGVELTPRGTIATDARFATSAPRVYAAGDAYRGASLIVWAISDGREAARAIDADLRDGTSRLPTRGADRPFG